MAKKKSSKSATKKRSVKKTAKKTTKKAAKKPMKKAVSKPVKKAAIAKPETSYETEQPRKDLILHSNKENITRRDKTNTMIFIGVLVAIILLLVLIYPSENNKDDDTVIEQGPAFSGAHILPALPTTATSIGESLVLNVEARNMDELSGFQMVVDYNSDVLRYKGLRYDNFLGSGDRKLCVEPSHTTGKISKISCARIPSTPGQLEGISGDGNLLFIDFEVIGRGSANIMISDVTLVDSNKELIEAQVIPVELKSR